jgi:hypothetical protein
MLWKTWLGVYRVRTAADVVLVRRLLVMAMENRCCASPLRDHRLELPLKVDETWTKQVVLGDNVYHSKWMHDIAERERKFAFRQVNNIGARSEGSGGVDGICWITYTLRKAGQGLTLFTRNLPAKTDKHVHIEDDMILAMAWPEGIDKYHADIGKTLSKDNI